MEGGAEEPAVYVTPDLGYEREGTGDGMGRSCSEQVYELVVVFVVHIFLVGVFAVFSYPVRCHLICLPRSIREYHVIVFFFSRLTSLVTTYNLYLSRMKNQDGTLGVVLMSLGTKNGVMQDDNNKKQVGT